MIDTKEISNEQAQNEQDTYEQRQPNKEKNPPSCQTSTNRIMLS
jgi:hypothetical protein